MGKTTLGMGKGSPLDARKLLDMHFLDIRSALLETAAALDRIERAKGGKEVMGDSRISKLFAACRIITDTGATDRAERFLTLFSSPETGP
ncbi:MAG: hypothetical protein DRH04_02560, partial [Deltaproteobacteria bacterium]